MTDTESEHIVDKKYYRVSIPGIGQYAYVHVTPSEMWKDLPRRNRHDSMLTVHVIDLWLYRSDRFEEKEYTQTVFIKRS
jgi:hypothetical protein